MKPQKPATPADMYFIAHVLPPHLEAQILEMKKDLFERFGCSVGLKSPAHITLVPPFWLAPEKAPQLQIDLHRLAASEKAFSLQTNDFSSFGKRTLFIAVAQSEPLQRLKIKADELFTGDDRYGLQRENRPFHPHITLATRDIKPGQFQEAWKLYSHRTFQHEWRVEGVSLLRHNRRHWEVMDTAPTGCT